MEWKDDDEFVIRKMRIQDKAWNEQKENHESKRNNELKTWNLENKVQ